jgi:hypothetical protein
MIPGFVRLGALVVLFQLVFVAACYAYVRYRHPVTDATARTRAARVVAVGTAAAAFGQLTALGAVGSLRVVDVLSFGQATTLANAGGLVALLGYVVTVGGLAGHVRASE